MTKYGGARQALTNHFSSQWEVFHSPLITNKRTVGCRYKLARVLGERTPARLAALQNELDHVTAPGYKAIAKYYDSGAFFGAHAVCVYIRRTTAVSRR